MSKWPQIRELIDNLIASDCRIDTVDKHEVELFAELSDSGFIHSDNGICHLDVLWVDTKQLTSLGATMAKYHKIMRDSVESIYQRFQKIVEQHAPSNVRSQIPAVAMLPVRLIGMFIVNDLSQSGYLRTLNEQEKKQIMILLQGKHRVAG